LENLRMNITSRLGRAGGIATIAVAMGVGSWEKFTVSCGH